MSVDLFTFSWFIVFILVILIAFLANLIIILAILRDKSMHTSTYFYIINVNIADILLLLSCLPERLAEVFGSNDGFHLGMFTCYLLPFIQQVSMHAALAFLLVLTVHRCYPAGVPRFLQGNLIRRQIRNYSQTLCLLWTFAILINLPLFSITNYEKNTINFTLTLENHTNVTYTLVESNCYTGANEVWSRTYLILLLVLTYLITGTFLIVIYGQVIRIILASNRYTKNSMRNTPQSNSDHYRYLSPNVINDENYRSKFVNRSKADLAIPHPSSSSSTANGSLRRQQTNSSAKPFVVRSQTTIDRNHLTKSSTPNSHSTQHLQVIIMLFIVIILYILLLLPYRLFNLLYIVHNQIFQQSFMNEVLFRWLLNSVRLLVFLNCALQPITYLIISSRLRQTVVKFLRSCYHCSIRCQCSSSSLSSSNDFHRQMKTDHRLFPKQVAVAIPNLSNRNKNHYYRDVRPLQTSLNNINPISLHGVPVGHVALISSRSNSPRATTRTLYTVSFLNRPRK